MDVARQGLALSKQFGGGDKLSANADPRIAMAGKLLKLAGGRKRRHHRRH
jgi:hypothetical protein